MAVGLNSLKSFENHEKNIVISAVYIHVQGNNIEPRDPYHISCILFYLL